VGGWVGGCKGVAQVEHLLSRKVQVREGRYMCIYEALSYYGVCMRPSVTTVCV
jgi:hypothetical protein